MELSDDNQLYIIYTEDEIVLSRKHYKDWRQIQAEHKFFKASLGPWTNDAVVDYLEFDYKELSPSAAEQVQSFLKSGDLTIALQLA
jgi:hypothetical protein